MGRIIKVGDDLIDDETGEYAGPADLTLPDRLTTQEHLTAWMHRLFNAESRLVAKQLELDTVIENCRKLLKKEEDRVSWLRRRYELDARMVLLESLPRDANGELKVKSLGTPWGEARLRTVAPTVSVTNEQDAIAWAEQNCPDAVKVKKSVLVTPVKAMFIDGQHLKEELPDGFEFVEARESLTVTTVKAPKGDA